jgi:ABC-type transport system involved in cytochrome c biogenesis permease subunit
MQWIQSLQLMRLNPLHPGVIPYAEMMRAYRLGNADGFNRALGEYQHWVNEQAPKAVAYASAETRFNGFEPFYQGMILYLIVFLLVVCSWLVWPEILGKTAFFLLIVAFSVHTVGLAARIILQGRPPVTNLYSSAIFVGWIAALLGTFLESRTRKGFGSLVASLIGFVTLIIAHHLTEQGDTMEMMRAVLDSNFWLSTHVVAITIGYSSTFLAGTLASVYILRGLLTPSLAKDQAKTLARMTYGVVCFSVLMSFTGTVLGGIWADQSWGRFWGWDPKENGALMIVLWNAIILHARWGGYIRERGLMVMAVFGNVVTSLSWFGVNMLGIGLHSYGWMDKAFYWLAFFIATQFTVMTLGLLPPSYWRSQPYG